jgi:spore maturation protein CgeB
MKLAVNYRGPMLRLIEGLRELGHEVVEEVWDSRRFAEEGFDALIIEFPTVFNKKRQSIPLMWKLKRMGVPVITWNLDSPWNMKTLNRFRLPPLLLLRFFSIYATHSLQNTSWISGTKVLYLPNAAWVKHYNLNGRTIEELEAKTEYLYDVSFIGNLSADRFPEHRKRVEFLRGLEPFLVEKGLKYIFVDSFRLDPPLTVSEQIDIIQNSRINLSCIAAADSSGVMSWGMTERSFGVPGCGGFLLSEERVHLKDNFDIATETATYAGIEECRQNILYYLSHEEERKRIMASAHKRVMQEHTYLDRARTLVDAIRVIKVQGADCVLPGK